MSALQQHVRRYGHVDPGYASRFQSDRTLNPNEMVCPPRHLYETMGRPAGQYSVNTTTAGCSDATERIQAENTNRLQTFSTSTLNQYGLTYGGNCTPFDKWEANSPQMQLQRKQEKQRHGQLPDFLFPQGIVLDDDQADYHQEMVDQQWIALGQKSLHYLHASGMI